jgi:hypothetical protein
MKEKSMKMMMVDKKQSSYSQFHATMILGTDETILRTQVK